LLHLSLVIKGLLLFVIYDEAHDWKIMFLKMCNTTKRECGQAQLFSGSFRTPDASTGVHCRKVVMFVDNCATDLLDMFMWSIKCVY
jgi:hypothetical protein